MVLFALHSVFMAMSAWNTAWKILLGLAAGATALLVLGGFVKKVFVGWGETYGRIKKVIDLAEHELNHNSGSSTKDYAMFGKDAAQSAAEAAEKASEAAERAVEEVKSLGDRFDAFEANMQQQVRAQWSAIEFLGKGHTPGPIERHVTEGNTDGNTHQHPAA
jgi:hypothetical protein